MDSVVIRHVVKLGLIYVKLCHTFWLNHTRDSLIFYMGDAAGNSFHSAANTPRERLDIVCDLVRWMIDKGAVQVTEVLDSVR